MATGLRLVTEISPDGSGQPILDAENGEELVHVQAGVSIVLGDGRRPPESPGTLFITTRQVVWVSDVDRAKLGYAVDFISISLHAVSTDPDAFPSPFLFSPMTYTEIPVSCPLKIETGAEETEMGDSDSETDDAINLSRITEMRLVPSDPNQLDTLFSMFCACAELNPDPAEAEEEGEHNWVFNVDHLENNDADDGNPEWGFTLDSTHAIGANGDDLSHSVVQLQINDQRFEDADEMDHEDKNRHH